MADIEVFADLIHKGQFTDRPLCIIFITFSFPIPYATLHNTIAC